MILVIIYDIMVIMKKIMSFCIAVLMMAGVAVGSFSGVAFAEKAIPGQKCYYSILGLRPWYQDLEVDGNCSVIAPKMDSTSDEEKKKIASFVWTIIANVIYDLMLVVGVVAVGFIIFSGYLFMTSGGDVAKVAKSKNTLIGAVIGLIVAVLATVIINTIMGILNVGGMT